MPRARRLWRLWTGFPIAVVIAALLLPIGACWAQPAHPAPIPPTSPPPEANRPPAQNQPPAPGPYKPVTVKLPAAVADSSFAAFRKQLSAVAQKRDRAALGKLVAPQGFFWDRENGDGADKNKSGFDNFAKAIGLDLPDDSDVGWDTISIYADDPTAAPNEDHPGVICGPADPEFNVEDLQTLLDTTQSDLGEWVYPLTSGVVLHSAAKDDAPVMETLGLFFVRMLPGDPLTAIDAQGNGFVRVITPSGRIGFVKTDAVASLGVSQICYVKQGGAWKITGVVGDPEQQ